MLVAMVIKHINNNESRSQFVDVFGGLDMVVSAGVVFIFKTTDE